ncbi:hypothetical protein AK830_g1453 [Neonectria ditissima]|uniref:Uncharacterized protein n=1 Tax=Neonectria ditissima TaxID=78410 RepID=A0A0P7B608_9HYPO|nr:hypothetical protein AK830_g1453 [Neonectria ditissima]
MPVDYTCLCTKSPRSFLFYVVANVGRGGTSCPLAVAYRQGNDAHKSPFSRVNHVVQDTLRLISILSEPANRAALEAERALAAAWYLHRDTEQHPDELGQQCRPKVPDSPQPPFGIPKGHWPVEVQPELSWDNSLREIPFTSTCLLLGLLDDDVSSNTRPGDVQLQPLSTAFRGDCLEYGMVVLDISDLENVKYGIVAFPVSYMAEVFHQGEMMGWDPIEDPAPSEEPDVVLQQHRPRVPLSILWYLRKYFPYPCIEKDPNVLKLEDEPLVDASALNYIWPLEVEDQRRAPSPGAMTGIWNYFWPSKSNTGDEEISTTTEHSTMSREPQSASMDRAVDNLLILTHNDLHLDAKAINKFQKLAKFQGQLRRRLEQVPDSLGPSEASGHMLRIAYAGCSHLNWVVFENMTYEAIAAAVASDELRSASALSLCIDGLNGDVGVLKATVARSSSLKQLCFLQKPDREDDNTSARLHAQLLEPVQESWLRNKTVYTTCAFSAPLRLETWPTRATPPVRDVPVMQMFVRQKRDVVDDLASQDSYYFMGDALLDVERFAVGFLSYLTSAQDDKSLLRFACGPSSLNTYMSKSLPTRFSVSSIPTELFVNLTADDGQAVDQPRVQDLEPGSWVVLINVERHNNVESNQPKRLKQQTSLAEAGILQYSFVRIRQTIPNDGPTEAEQFAPELIEVVGGLKDFLRETAPSIDAALVERLLEEAEQDLGKRGQALLAPRTKYIDVPKEDSAREMFKDLLKIARIRTRLSQSKVTREA